MPALLGHRVRCTPSLLLLVFLWYYLMFQRLPFKLAISQRDSRGQLSHHGSGCQDKYSQRLREDSPPGMKPQTLARVMPGQIIDTEASPAQGQGK